MQIHGACHCGRVTFTAEIDPARVTVCHCTDCQVFSGSAFRLGVVTAPENFHVRGQTRRYVKTADGGNRRAQVFCPECGTALYATSPDDTPGPVSIRVGCIEERAQLRPAAQIWQRSALPWVCELDAIPAAAQQQLPPIAAR